MWLEDCTSPSPSPSPSSFSSAPSFSFLFLFYVVQEIRISPQETTQGLRAAGLQNMIKRKLSNQRGILKRFFGESKLHDLKERVSIWWKNLMIFFFSTAECHPSFLPGNPQCLWWPGSPASADGWGQVSLPSWFPFSSFSPRGSRWDPGFLLASPRTPS